MREDGRGRVEEARRTNIGLGRVGERAVGSWYLGAGQLGSGGEDAAVMGGMLLGWLAVLPLSSGSWESQSGSASLDLIQLSLAGRIPSPSTEAPLQQKHSMKLSWSLPFRHDFTHKLAVV